MCDTLKHTRVSAGRPGGETRQQVRPRHQIAMTTNESCTNCAACGGCEPSDEDTEPENRAESVIDDAGPPER